MTAGKKTTIMIAEDHPLFRKALKDLVGSDESLELVAETGDGSNVTGLVAEKKPEILLLDLNLPHITGLEAMQQLHETGSEVKIIVLTMHKEEEMFNRVMDAGVFGYVLKEAAVDVILESIKRVSGGDHYISPSLSHFLIARRRKLAAVTHEHPGLGELTPTERRILKLIAVNKTSREIAALLFVSEKTVENHRMNISNKLNLHGSNSLLKFAIEHRSTLQSL